MNEQIIAPSAEVSFKDFLFKNKRNRTTLILAAVAIVVQFSIFKYLYPFASFIHGDSFSYLKAADYNLDLNTYLIGYSRFLRLFSVFSKSDFALTAFQYLFIQSSSLFLLFSVFFFYKPQIITQFLLLLFFTFNPLSLHLGNLVSSDCLFVALSLYWFTLLLWIINRPSTRIIIWQTIVLFIAFTVRYNALIYPFIGLVAFGLSKLSMRKKILGVGMGMLLCGLFIFFTSYKYKMLSGHWQYSPFSGWQFANNAMYAYRYVAKSDRKPVPSKYLKLDNMIRDFFDSTRDTKRYPTEAIQASTFYMWSPGMPLMKYKNTIFKKDTSSSDMKKWASMGPFYKDYGLHIIKTYPLHFINYFIWPNALKYYAPPVEFMKNYNSGRKDVTEQAKNWFGYKTRNVKTRMKNNKVWVLDFYPIFSGITNVVLLLTTICFISLKGWKINNVFTKGIIMGGTVWILNAAFTISASSAALRFQSFPILINTIFMALLVDWMVRLLNKNAYLQMEAYPITIRAAVQ
jgi:hypothetical protein